MLASKTIVQALDGPVQCTVSDLLEEYGHNKLSLEGMAKIDAVLNYYKIVMDPELGEYDALYARTLKPKREPSKIKKKIDDLLAEGGENYGVELKSTIYIDTKKRKHCPDLSLTEFVSDKLKSKVAQELAAFLNRDGGILLFGVSNDHTIIGCEDDFTVFETDGSPQDKADLIIKQIVDKHFYNSKKALSCIQIDCEEYRDKFVVMLSIAPASELCFLKASQFVTSALYVRIGTSAEPIPFHEVESYFQMKRIT